MSRTGPAGMGRGKGADRGGQERARVCRPSLWGVLTGGAWLA